MCINRDQLRETVSALIANLDVGNLSDPEERQLCIQFGALPIGTSLWALVLLTPDGEVISTDLEPGELHRSRAVSQLIRVLVWASERYPQLKPLIPDRPATARDCVLCSGSGICKGGMSGDMPMKCILCGGVGWDLNDAELAVAAEPAQPSSTDLG